MKLKYIAAFGFATLMTLGSCGEDFLYKAPQGAIDEGALTNAQGIDLLVINAYANLTENGWGATPFNWAQSGMYGGDANKGSDPGDQSVLNEMELYNTMSTNGYLNEKYEWVFKGSKRVAMAMKVIANATEVDEGFKSQRLAELNFLRAFFYFEGVRLFGPYIPYLDESFQENDPKVYNDKDIYPNILADIDAAIAGLPNTQSEVGRPNVWAAKALKAKILMQKGDMATAKPILQDCIDNGVTSNGLKYELEDRIDDNWSSYTENGKESVFAIQFSVEANDNANNGMSLCYPHNSGPGGCCGFYQPSFELVNSFRVDADGLPYLNSEYRTMASLVTIKPADASADDPISFNDNAVAVDPRLDIAVGRYGIPYKDWGFPANDWVRNPVNGGVFLPRKHVFSKAEFEAGLGGKSYGSGWAPGSAMNIQYLSVRDLILLYAECLADEGNFSGAMEQVNLIRTRAAHEKNITLLDGAPAANYKIALYPTTHAAFSNKEMCVKAVRMERKLELAMEGQRGMDLFRWGGDYMAAEISAYIDYEKQYIPKFAGASKLPAAKTMFPLPDTQLQTMGNDENGKPYLTQPAAWQ